MKQIPVSECEGCKDNRKGEKHRYCRRTFTILKGKEINCPKGKGEK